MQKRYQIDINHLTHCGAVWGDNRRLGRLPCQIFRKPMRVRFLE